MLTTNRARPVDGAEAGLIAINHCSANPRPDGSFLIPSGPCQRAPPGIGYSDARNLDRLAGYSAALERRRRQPLAHQADHHVAVEGRYQQRLDMTRHKYLGRDSTL
jgi:hypothetical protein